MEKTFRYYPKGTCSREMIITIDDKDQITGLQVIGGCNGNLKGIGALVKGMTAEEVIARLEGIQCGFKTTSCPDQLAKALRSYLEEK